MQTQNRLVYKLERQTLTTKHKVREAQLVVDHCKHKLDQANKALADQIDLEKALEQELLEVQTNPTEVH